MGSATLGLGLALGAGFFKFLAGAAVLACKALTSFPFCGGG